MTKELFIKRASILERMDLLEEEYFQNDLQHLLFFEIRKELINQTHSKSYEMLELIDLEIIPGVINLLTRAIKFYESKNITINKKQRLELIYLIIINYSQIIENNDDSLYIFKNKLAYEIYSPTDSNR